jgi:hypothetical protein
MALKKSISDFPKKKTFISLPKKINYDGRSTLFLKKKYE